MHAFVTYYYKSLKYYDIVFCLSSIVYSLLVSIGKCTSFLCTLLPMVHSYMNKWKTHVHSCIQKDCPRHHTCSGISSHGWINSSPSDTHSVSHTKAHIHICACVDHLLTMLCNSSTCLGLRLLFPSRKLTMSGLYKNCLPFFSFFFFFVSSLCLLQSGAWPGVLHYSVWPRITFAVAFASAYLIVIAFYLTVNLPSKMNGLRSPQSAFASLQPFLFNISPFLYTFPFTVKFHLEMNYLLHHLCLLPFLLFPSFPLISFLSSSLLP